jgi:hypothetical protein
MFLNAFVDCKLVYVALSFLSLLSHRDVARRRKSCGKSGQPNKWPVYVTEGWCRRNFLDATGPSLFCLGACCQFSVGVC